MRKRLIILIGKPGGYMARVEIPLGWHDMTVMALK